MEEDESYYGIQKEDRKVTTERLMVAFWLHTLMHLSRYILSAEKLEMFGLRGNLIRFKLIITFEQLKSETRGIKDAFSFTHTAIVHA